jgi:hypothetical protein
VSIRGLEFDVKDFAGLFVVQFETKIKIRQRDCEADPAEFKIRKSFGRILLLKGEGGPKGRMRGTTFFLPLTRRFAAPSPFRRVMCERQPLDFVNSLKPAFIFSCELLRGCCASLG